METPSTYTQEDDVSLMYWTHNFILLQTHAVSQRAQHFKNIIRAPFNHKIYGDFLAVS